MEIVMKKMETFCPRKEHLTMVAAAAGIAMVLAYWCLVWPVAGAQAGPLAALVVGTALPYALEAPLLPHDFPPTLCTGHCNCTGRRASSLSVACPAAFLDALCHARSIRRVHKKTGKQTASCRMAAISLDSEKRLQYTFI